MSCKCSFLEIYNENITDLLSPSEAHLQIREDAARGTYVENLCEEEVSSGTAHDAGTCMHLVAVICFNTACSGHSMHTLIWLHVLLCGLRQICIACWVITTR